MEKPIYIPLEELDIYKQAMEIGEMVWDIVDKWAYFLKKAVGCQFVEATDSIASNISEGYGRFHFKEKRTFYFYSRGSLLETKTWATKSSNRRLLSEQQYDLLIEKLSTLHKDLNQTIKSLPI